MSCPPSALGDQDTLVNGMAAACANRVVLGSPSVIEGSLVESLPFDTPHKSASQGPSTPPSYAVNPQELRQKLETIKKMEAFKDDRRKLKAKVAGADGCPEEGASEEQVPPSALHAKLDCLLQKAAGQPEEPQPGAEPKEGEGGVEDGKESPPPEEPMTGAEHGADVAGGEEGVPEEPSSRAERKENEEDAQRRQAQAEEDARAQWEYERQKEQLAHEIRLLRQRGRAAPSGLCGKDRAEAVKDQFPDKCSQGETPMDTQEEQAKFNERTKWLEGWRKEAGIAAPAVTVVDSPSVAPPEEPKDSGKTIGSEKPEEHRGQKTDGEKPEKGKDKSASKKDPIPEQMVMIRSQKDIDVFLQKCKVSHTPPTCPPEEQSAKDCRSQVRRASQARSAPSARRMSSARTRPIRTAPRQRSPMMMRLG